MTTLISALSLHLEAQHGPLFADLSFTLKAGDRIGLLGHNGCGKSTLLALLAGRREAGGGTLHYAHALRLQYVEQHLPPSLASASLRTALADVLPSHAEGDTDWRVNAMLDTLGLSDVADVPPGALSGGQHTRLLLGRALLQEPNLLLLDEPSNHLDLPALLWLEDFLLTWRGAFVLVSHDRRLLDRVSSTTWILRDRRLQAFDLPCSAALDALAAADVAAAQRHAAEQKEIDRISASAARLAQWSRINENESMARKARTMERRAERLASEQTVVTEGTPWTLALQGRALAARQLLGFEGLPVRAAPGLAPLFVADGLAVRPGERIALLGANGSGKSSLLRQLWQALESGQEMPGLARHPGAAIGYYDQAQRQLPDDATLADALYPFAARGGMAGEAARRHALIRAGFAYARHGQRVATLSGGERARLLFLALSLAAHHLLLLDEPTNHLDLQGKDELATALRGFSGALLLVSHDRDLVDACCTRFWVLADGRLTEYLDPAAAYARLFGCRAGQNAAAAGDPPSRPAGAAADRGEDDETRLAHLLELERLLAEDQARKAKFQKPQLQAMWREEMARLSAALGL